MSLRPLREVPTHDVIEKVIANSQSIEIFDAVVPNGTNTNAVAGAAGTTGRILGVVVGFGLGGPKSALQEADSITVEADNETDKKITAYIIPVALDIEYEADLDADVGTTSGSDGMGYFNLDGADSALLNEASYLPFDNVSSPLQFFSYGPVEHPKNDVRKVIGRFEKIL